MSRHSREWFRQHMPHCHYYVPELVDGFHWMPIKPCYIDTIKMACIRFIEHQMVYHNFGFNFFVPLIRIAMQLRTYKEVTSRSDLKDVEVITPKNHIYLKKHFVIQVDNYFIYYIVKALKYDNQKILAEVYQLYYDAEIKNITPSYVSPSKEDLFQQFVQD